MNNKEGKHSTKAKNSSLGDVGANGLSSGLPLMISSSNRSESVSSASWCCKFLEGNEKRLDDVFGHIPTQLFFQK